MKKIPMICVISLPVSLIMEASRYIFQDWEFLRWLLVAIIIDTVLGVVKHFIIKDVSSEDFFSKFGKKMFFYMMLLILSNLLQNYKVHGEYILTTQWLSTYLCVFMMVREVFSCVENIQAIYPILPASFIKRLKDFNDKGEYMPGTNDGFGKDVQN